MRVDKQGLKIECANTKYLYKIITYTKVQVSNGHWQKQRGNIDNKNLL